MYIYIYMCVYLLNLDIDIDRCFFSKDRHLEGMSELCGVIAARLWHEAQLNRNMHETYCELIVISLSYFEINTTDMWLLTTCAKTLPNQVP